MIALYHHILALVLYGTLLLPHPSKVQSHYGECPHYWAGTDHGLGALGDTLPIAGQQANVPEYNDCQRFIERNLTYSAIQAVWVHERVAQFYNRVNALTPPSGGTPTEDLNGQPAVFLGAGDSSGAVTASGRIAVVGLVWSTGKYTQLGLADSGFTCVVMRWRKRNAAVSDSYSALMVHVKDKFDCVNLRKLHLNMGYPLEVTALSPRTGDRTPQVARWDWDAESKDQYMGMWCPSGWCEFHNKGYHTSPSHNSGVGSYAGVAGMAVREKGFYDDQFLAAPASSGNAVEAGPLGSAGPIRGTIYPEPNIGSRSLPQYDRKWLRVARVSLSDSSKAYLAKYLYTKHPADPDDKHAFISLCFVKAASEVSRDTPDAQRPCPGPVPARTCERDNHNNGFWYMQIDNPTQKKIRSYCVVYRKAPKNVLIPSVVRWRWTKRDEIIWSPCPGGCCEGDGIGP